MASTSSAGPSTGSWLSTLSCRRRDEAAEAQAVAQRYEALLARGRSLSEKQRYFFDKLSYWSDAPTKKGSRIFVLVPRGPRGQTEFWIDMWDLLAYCLTKLHEHVVTDGRPFAVVWVQLSDHRLGLLALRRLRESLLPKYYSQLEAVHVVHPSWMVRLLRFALWPIARDEYWAQFYCHERIEFLDTHVDTRKFRLPKDVYEFDKWLDKQAQEQSEQANKRFGVGSSAGAGARNEFGAEEEANTKQRLDMMQKMMQQQGHGKAE